MTNLQRLRKQEQAIREKVAKAIAEGRQEDLVAWISNLVEDEKECREALAQYKEEGDWYDSQVEG